MRFTGILPGEAYALKWEDFDFEKGIVKIRRALSYSSEYDKAERKAQKRKSIFKNLKNDKNSRNTEITPYRNIPINDDVIKAIKEWRQFVETAKCNDRTLYIFDSERGDYYFKDKNGSQKYVETSKITNLPTII